MIKVAISFKSQRTEKIELFSQGAEKSSFSPKGLKNRAFSQGTDGSMNLRYESLISVDYR